MTTPIKKLRSDLEREIARVRDETLPPRLRIGLRGENGANWIRRDLGDAALALALGDRASMKRALEVLKGWGP